MTRPAAGSAARRWFRASSSLVTPVDTAGVVAATLFALAGLSRPGMFPTGATPDSATRFWAASSAVRTWAVTGPLLAAVATRRPVPPELLRAAAFVQLGDAVVGIWQRNPSMTVAPAAMAWWHLRSARRHLRPDERP